MSTGSIRPRPSDGASGVVTSGTYESFLRPRAGMVARAAAAPFPSLDVEELDVLGVALDERPAGLDVLTHQHAEHLVSLRCIIHSDLLEHPLRRVHRGVPQL